jgi:hypothetical protein
MAELCLGPRPDATCRFPTTRGLSADSADYTDSAPPSAIRQSTIGNRKSRIPRSSRSLSRCSSERILTCAATGVGTRVCA